MSKNYANNLALLISIGLFQVGKIFHFARKYCTIWSDFKILLFQQARYIKQEMHVEAINNVKENKVWNSFF